jgi:hypothetical protein
MKFYGKDYKAEQFPLVAMKIKREMRARSWEWETNFSFDSEAEREDFMPHWYKAVGYNSHGASCECGTCESCVLWRIHEEKKEAFFEADKTGDAELVAKARVEWDTAWDAWLRLGMGLEEGEC